MKKNERRFFIAFLIAYTLMIVSLYFTSYILCFKIDFIGYRKDSILIDGANFASFVNVLAGILNFFLALIAFAINSLLSIIVTIIELLIFKWIKKKKDLYFRKEDKKFVLCYISFLVLLSILIHVLFYGVDIGMVISIIFLVNFFIYFCFSLHIFKQN